MEPVVTEKLRYNAPLAFEAFSVEFVRGGQSLIRQGIKLNSIMSCVAYLDTVPNISASTRLFRSWKTGSKMRTP